jgi:hypothetical protein
MKSGYVLDFNNRTLQEFILDSVQIDIFSNNYADDGTSKANRLRCLLRKESNHAVGKLLNDLIDYVQRTTNPHGYPWIDNASKAEFESQILQARLVAGRLQKSNSVENIDAIEPITSERNALLLVRSIRDALQRDEPEAALDRLHTYLMSYARFLCDKYGIEYTQHEPLHSIFAKYVK